MVGSFRADKPPKNIRYVCNTDLELEIRGYRMFDGCPYPVMTNIVRIRFNRFNSRSI